MIYDASGNVYTPPQPAKAKASPCRCGRYKLSGYNGICQQESITDSEEIVHTREDCSPAETVLDV